MCQSYSPSFWDYNFIEWLWARMQLIGQQVELFSPYCICFKYLTINKTYSFSENSGLEKSPVQTSRTSRFSCGTSNFSGLLAQWSMPRQAICRLNSDFKTKKVNFGKHVTAWGKQNLKIACPKGKLKSKFFFSSPEIAKPHLVRSLLEPFNNKAHYKSIHSKFKSAYSQVWACVVVWFVAQVSCPHKEKGEGIYCFTTLMEVLYIFIQFKINVPYFTLENQQHICISINLQKK